MTAASKLRPTSAGGRVLGPGRRWPDPRQVLSRATDDLRPSAWRGATSWQAAANACMQVQRWPQVSGRTGGGASRMRADTFKSLFSPRVVQIKDKGNLNSYSRAPQSESETNNRAGLSLIHSCLPGRVLLVIQRGSLALSV